MKNTLKRFLHIFTFIITAAVITGCAGYKSSMTQNATNGDPELTEQKVFISSPKDGATVPQTFTVKFGAKNVEIIPAGTIKTNAGHHHLIIDSEYTSKKPIPKGVPQFKHFGKGQTETEITLEPGTHTLQLILGDGSHTPFDPSIQSEKITITVK